VVGALEINVKMQPVPSPQPFRQGGLRQRTHQRCTSNTLTSTNKLTSNRRLGTSQSSTLQLKAAQLYRFRSELTRRLNVAPAQKYRG
jgi:hypothetical protein